MNVILIKSFIHDEQMLDQKQKMWLKVNAIEHKFVIEIESIFHAR